MKPSLLNYVFLLFCTGLSLTAVSQAGFSNSTLEILVDKTGNLSSVVDVAGQKEYLYRDTAAPFLQVKTGGAWQKPVSMHASSKNTVLSFRYPSRITIDVKVRTENTHLVFEIIKATPADRISRVQWGSYPVTIGDTVGEIVGVVRNNTFAFGLQVLNIKTIGGVPFNEEGFDPSRGSVALPRSWGSVLQAYSINRTLPRTAAVWNGAFKNMPIEPLPGETVVGSKIALFGATPGMALQTIGAIEVAEGLPHPVFDGVWIKQSPELGRSYIISDFTESDVDKMIGYVKQAGLMSLYHEGPFKTWGHYDFNPQFFPTGKAGVKQAVEKAHAAGIRFGVHTLTNFINPTDSYVSPVPDERLVRSGSSNLTTALADTATEIGIAGPDYFDYPGMNNLHLVKIGNELIRYSNVSKHAPYKLLNCQRGAFGTKASAHAKNDRVDKLLDHAYEVVFPNMALQTEIATNLAKLFNETGIDHMDFDGHEGGMASGQGDYGIETFAKTFYDNVDHFVVNGTSNSKPFYWHINTYCNWGEPWYGGFKESMQEYRVQNQALFERNYMPNMLGWYLMTATTSLAEMEWMLARAAGYKAGFAMVLRVNAAAKNPCRDTLLSAICEWESARRASAFTPEQQERLKNPENEFHLEKASEGEWRLYPYHTSAGYTHAKKERQPGEPAFSTWTVTNKDAGQPLQLILEVQGETGSVSNPVLTIDGASELALPVLLMAKERLVIDGTQLVRLYDTAGRQRNTITLSSIPLLLTGTHTITFRCGFDADVVSQHLIVYFRTKGASETVKNR